MEQNDNVSLSEASKTFIPNVKKASWAYRFSKRLGDIVLASLAFLLLLPLLFLLTLANAIACKGNPFFGDKRVGRKGKEITLYKFRSMFHDAETHPEKYLNEQQMKEWVTERKVTDDPRVIPFGVFLRKTSLDELPQLLNIIGGSLSIVGPRAITPWELNTYYSEAQKAIFLSCRPGLTGYWQVKARNDATYESGRRTILEMTYFEKRGFFYDFYLILATLPSMLKHQGQ
jgi:lipopolysaccharide/colanic/teichoic acid biosynthesis glycosyltransferase